MRYGVCHPKYSLLDSKTNIAPRFKDANPGCPFSVSVICREFPQNAVSASNREKERNTCPIHANARRLLKCIHQNKVGMDVEMSCRQMCALAMCARDDVDIADPLTWNEECVFGNCIKCKNPKIPFPNSIKNIEVSYSAWQHGEKVQETKKKKCKDMESKEGEEKEGICFVSGKDSYQKCCKYFPGVFAKTKAAYLYCQQAVEYPRQCKGKSYY